MTGARWPRPDPHDAASKEIPVFEVPLDGERDEHFSRGTTEPTPRKMNRRTVAGLSTIGVVLAIVVAVAIATAGADDAAPPSTLDPDDVSTVITAPPTLVPAESDRSMSFDPATTVSTLPQREGVDPDSIEGFELDAASLARFDETTPRRSITEYVAGVDGFEQTTTMTTDPATGRYLIETDFGELGLDQTAIFDPADGSVYFLTSGLETRWVRSRPSSWLPDAAAVLRTLQLGPIRSDTFDAISEVRANSLVDVPDIDEELREYVVIVDASAIPEWAQYALANGVPDSTNGSIGFAVYVNRSGEIRRVTGSWDFGSTTQRIVHTIETLDEATTIELPDPSLLVDPPGPPTPAEHLANSYRQVEPPAVLAPYELRPALERLAVERPLRANISVRTTRTYSTASVELDPERNLYRMLLTRSGIDSIVDLATGDALTRFTIGGEWRPVTGGYDPLLPEPMLRLDDIESLLASRQEVDAAPDFRRLTVGRTVRRFVLELGPDQLALQPAMDVGATRGATVEVYVDGNGDVAELQVLIDGDEPRVVTQRFRRLAEPPVITWPLDD